MHKSKYTTSITDKLIFTFFSSMKFEIFQHFFAEWVFEMTSISAFSKQYLDSANN